MVRRRMLLRMVLGHLRLRFLVALGVLCFGWAALTIDFLWKWHRHGDAYAQAFGSLLAFFASIITAAVTLTYLHVSRRSLAAAEAAIQLQRDQWESRLTVKPRFWMGVQSDQHHKAMNITYRRDVSDAYHKDAGRHFYDSLPWPHVAVDVWNDGERSLRIASYRLWIKDEDHLSIEKPLAGFVVPPNELRASPSPKISSPSVSDNVPATSATNDRPVTKPWSASASTTPIGAMTTTPAAMNTGS
jgi:hypothetical protein